MSYIHQQPELGPSPTLYLPGLHCAAGVGWWRNAPAGTPARPRPPECAGAPRFPCSGCQGGLHRCGPSRPPGCESTAVRHTPYTPAAGWVGRSPWGSGSSTQRLRRNLPHLHYSQSRGTAPLIHLQSKFQANIVIWINIVFTSDRHSEYDFTF